MVNIKKYVQPILIVLLVFLAVHLYQSKNDAEAINKQNIKASLGKEKRYVDKLGRLTQEKNSYVLTNLNLLKQNDSLKETIKNIKPEVVVKWRTRYLPSDTIEIPYKEEIPYKFNVAWEKKMKWLEISGRSTNKGITIENYLIPNDQSLVVGYQRKWLLGASEATVKISNTNPDIKTSSLESYIIKPKKRFIDKWYVKVGAGLLIGKYVLK